MIALSQEPGTKLERWIAGVIAHRMGLWFWLSVAGVVAIWVLANHQIGVLLWKSVLMTVAAYLGYWISRQLEKGKRPHHIFEEARIAGIEGNLTRQFELESLANDMARRRSWIVGAAMIAAALGT